MTQLAPDNDGAGGTHRFTASDPRSGSPGVRISILLICVVTLLAFAPVLENELVNWDDQGNLVRNDAYQGLSPGHLRWMFTTTLAGHYQPLTWLSFAVDYRIWGVDAVGFHLTNLLLHVVTAVGVFFIARRIMAIRLSRATGQSIVLGALLAALVFAVHPLRVESVAWATERRDVLSGIWLTLTMVFYLRAAVAGSPVRYRVMLAISIVCYILSLLSKAAGITLPAALLILDIYPLRRLAGRGDLSDRAAWRTVLLEKALFLLPAMLFALVALWAQAQSGALRSSAEHSIGLRIGQAFYGIVFYPFKTIWPVGLAPLYEQTPDAMFLDSASVVSAALAIVISALLWIWRRRTPGLVAAWGIYIVLVSPVLGLAQSGPQVVADRYSYLSCLPWVVLLGAAVALRWSKAVRHGQTALAVVSLALVIVCVCLTRGQVRIWKDSRSLWTAVIDRGGSAGIAHANLAAVLNETREYKAACDHAHRALDTLPGNRTAHVALGRCSTELGDLVAAETHYARALEIADAVEKTDIATMVALAIVKTRLGKPDHAEQLYREVAAAEPRSPLCRYGLASFLASRGKNIEAKRGFEETLQLDPTHTGAHLRLGVVLLELGDPAGAIAAFQEGLRYAPGDVLLDAKLAWVLATCADNRLRHGARALTLAREAVENAEGSSLIASEALAAALAETGDFEGAALTLENLLSGEVPRLSEPQVQRLRSQLERYRQHRPVRE